MEFDALEMVSFDDAAIIFQQLTSSFDGHDNHSGSRIENRSVYLVSN
jgi:hypothetical protein